MVNKPVGISEGDELEAAASTDAAPSSLSGWDMGQPLGFDMGPQGGQGGMSFDFEGFDGAPSSLSLDDFDAEPGSTAEAGPYPDIDRESYEPGDESKSAESDAVQAQKRRKKLILLLSALACVGVVIAIAVPVYLAMKPKAPALLGKKSVRHTVSIPEFQEELEFLVLAKSEQDQNLINMRLSFVFSASNACEDFSSKGTFYRETVYQYLLAARPVKNSQKLWQGILEKQLAEYIKQTFPKSGLQTIRVSHWERL